MGKTYLSCARKLPSERNCRGCIHAVTCDLFDESNPLIVEDHEEKALIAHKEDQREWAELAHMEGE